MSSSAAKKLPNGPYEFEGRERTKKIYHSTCKPDIYQYNVFVPSKQKFVTYVYKSVDVNTNVRMPFTS